MHEGRRDGARSGPAALSRGVAGPWPIPATMGRTRRGESPAMDRPHHHAPAARGARVRRRERAGALVLESRRPVAAPGRRWGPRRVRGDSPRRERTARHHHARAARGARGRRIERAGTERKGQAPARRSFPAAVGLSYGDGRGARPPGIVAPPRRRGKGSAISAQGAGRRLAVTGAGPVVAPGWDRLTVGGDDRGCDRPHRRNRWEAEQGVSRPGPRPPSYFTVA
jgi:hypothetical protein